MKRQVEYNRKDDLDDIPLRYVLYIVLGLVAAVAGATTVIFRMLQHP
jgi:hypothetical protein